MATSSCHQPCKYAPTSSPDIVFGKGGDARAVRGESVLATLNEIRDVIALIVLPELHAELARLFPWRRRPCGPRGGDGGFVVHPTTRSHRNSLYLAGMDAEALGAEKPSPGFSQATVTAALRSSRGTTKRICIARSSRSSVPTPTLGSTAIHAARSVAPLGAECDDDGLPRFPWGEAGTGAENWQLLSPVRARPGGVVGLNELVRRTWRGTDVQMARRARRLTSPMGADQVIFADKVMVLRNDHDRNGKVPGTWEKVPGSVANGEVGVIVNRADQQRSTGRTHARAIDATRPPVRLLEKRAQRRQRGRPGRMARARLCRYRPQEPGVTIQGHLRGHPGSVRAAVA